MRILPTWLREFVNVTADDRQLAEDLTSAGIAVESVAEENSETIYEMDLTTNRVDAMNHYGVAREASAIYGVDLKKVEPKVPQASGEANFPIVIEDGEGCARYTGRIIRNVTIGPSPAHIVKRLELLGSRAINNAADATNYAINELGHPTHAFDLDLLEGGTIIVRRAREGETLKTLDGVDRKLSTDDLVIADAKKPVALAGVMGGFDSMITQKTKNVLIESAWFDPASIRRTAKRHMMHTDASHRFERGADWGITPLACDRVAELILESAGGELIGERIDTVARSLERPPIALHRSEVKRILGIDLSEQEIEGILGRLGFAVTTAVPGPTPTLSQQMGQNGAPAEFSVTIPTWRLDVEREIDLLEELARIYGYNKFPNTLPSFAGAVIALPGEQKDAKIRETMLAHGYDETISITFVSEQDARAFGATDPLPLANPLSEEAGYMRNSLVPGLLNMVAYNLNRGNNDVRLFEAGEVFAKYGERHEEHRTLAFTATGGLTTTNVHCASEPYTFFHMKGDVEDLLTAFQHQTLYFDAMTTHYLHPGRSARAVLDGETVARFGQLHPEIAAFRKLRQDVYIAEIFLDRLYKHDLREPKYERISKFPAVERDFSFVFNDDVTFERIRSAVQALGIAEMQIFEPREIYRGDKVGADKYSVLLHSEFQSKERTLRDDEVAQWSAQIVETLEKLGGVLRA